MISKKQSPNPPSTSLVGQVHVLPDEDGEAFDAFSIRLTRAYDPKGVLEVHYAEQLVRCTWLLHRIGAIEGNVFALGQNAAIAWNLEWKAVERLFLYEERLHRRLHRAHATFKALQATRKVRQAKEEIAGDKRSR
jgi:hypothetical protein